MEEKLKDLKDLNFYFTDNMKQTLFDMMAIQKLLESDDLDYKQQKELEKEKNRLLDIFRTELQENNCLLYTSPSPRDDWLSRMPSSA